MWMWIQGSEDFLRHLPHPAEQLGDWLVELEDSATLPHSFDDFGLRGDLLSS